MVPNPAYFLEKTGIEIPPIGFYDAPNMKPFKPLTEPVRGKHACIFAFYRQWLKGKTLHVTEDNFGCGGAGHWIFGKPNRDREEFIKFLADDEGLKANRELMGKWIDTGKPYRRRYEHILIGPLNDNQYDFLRTVTFFVNPDQLSILTIAAQYYAAPEGAEPVIAPFGAGCMLMISLFKGLDLPQAVIGATDLAMRKYIGPELMAFTVTKSMYERICNIGEDSFLTKSYLEGLKKARASK